MRPYRIPVIETFLPVHAIRYDIKARPPPPLKKIFLNIGGKGLRVYYQTEKDLDLENIQKHLRLRDEPPKKQIDVFIETSSPEEAVQNFFNEEGAKTGEISKAWQIDENGKIIELPSCELLSKNGESRFICGKSKGEEGKSGMCVLETCAPPEIIGCPIENFWNLYHRKRKKGLLKTGTLAISGKTLKIIKARDVLN